MRSDRRVGRALAIDGPRRYKVAVPQYELVDLAARLKRVRWTEELSSGGWDYGVPLALVKEQVGYWRTAYDWRRHEANLNRYPQFITILDGQPIHFIHLRSPENDALPLIVTHGWPGSVFEFLEILEPLADPARHGGDPTDAFDLVVPSLPGFGFSGPTRERGWNVNRIARAWAALMGQLGYRHYGAAGNDWGASVSIELGRVAPAAVSGVHVTQIVSLPSGAPGELDGLSDDEQAALADRSWFNDHMDAYHHLQAQQPQSLAHALTDSPVGLLAWFDLIFRGGVDIEFVLTNVMTHWLTRTVASAMRIYAEAASELKPHVKTTVPLGLAQFAHDFKSIRRFAERDHANIVSWNVYDRGSHFAAHDAPDILVADLRAFFRATRGAPSSAA
jgi:pimeloyl-ACP methyl ester carboxylesterase